LGVAEGDELVQLQRLHAEGMITEAEFELARTQLHKRGSADAEEPTVETAEKTAEASGDDAQTVAEPAPDVQPDAEQSPDVPAAAEPEPVGESQPEPATEPQIEPQTEPATDADAPSPRRRRQLPTWAMITWPLVLAAGGIGLIVWALVGGSGTAKTPVNGLIAIVDHQSVVPDQAVPDGSAFGTGGYALGKPCHTLSGYPDIATGAPVVITDAAEKTLARTNLRAGVFDVNADCVFGFVTSVPKSDTYQIKVGQRDAVTYPAAAITHPQLSLGGS
jgi:hypothetical protein